MLNICSRSTITWLQMAALVYFLHLTTVSSGRKTGQTTCPKICKCAIRMSKYLRLPLHTTDCANRKLSSLPQNISLNTEVLLLRGNNIEVLDAYLFKLSVLQVLDLSYNRINSLGSQPMFANLSQLQYLDVSSNRLSYLLHGSFSGLMKLSHLNLAKNRLNHLETHAFGGLNHLTHLDLSGNLIELLSLTWFDDLVSLDVLHFNNNNLEEIPDGVFQPLTLLNVLNLDDNRISSLTKQSFLGLDMLNSLSLKQNNFTTIPTEALAIFKMLKILSFDDNPVEYLLRHSFFQTSVTELSLCNMQSLKLIDKESFVDMPYLTILHIHDNPQLLYIDAKAFQNLPGVSHLYLHNNHILSLPQKLILDLTNLQELHFYHNPIQCDCNAHWLSEVLNVATSNNTSSNETSTTLFIHTPDQIVCATPKWLRGQSLSAVKISMLPRFCRPTVLPFFKDSIQVALGASVKYQCRGIGVPPPHIYWILPNGKILNSSSNLSRLQHDEPGTVQLNHIKTTDAGTFSCVATSKYGYDTSSTILAVHSTRMHILPVGISSTFITVTWNGTDRTVSTTDYLIQYHRRGNANTTSHSIHLRPYMRTYTVSNLQPQTMYQFCIAYRSNKQLVQLNCVDISTRDRAYRLHGIYSIKDNISVAVGLSTAGALLVMLCVGGIVFQRHQRRKSYQEPQSPATSGKVEGMSNIPLENLYHPPSTPLCSSRTSLIRSSTA